MLPYLRGIKSKTGLGSRSKVHHSAAWAMQSGKHHDYGETREERRCRGEFRTSPSGRMSEPTPGFGSDIVLFHLHGRLHIQLLKNGS